MTQPDIQFFVNGFVSALQLPAPDACLAAIRELTEKGLYPVIVKPVDSAGSKGCSRVDRQENLEKAISYARSESHNGRIIIEQFLEKVGHSSDTDSFSINNELVYARNTCPIAQDIASRVLTLPTYYGLPLADVKDIAYNVLEIVKG